MKMMKTFVPFLCLLCCLPSGKALPLNHEMFKASTVEELGVAQEALHKVDLRSLQVDDDNEWEQSEPKLAADYGGPAGFYHGVASGDPLPDAIVLWTRWTPDTVEDEIIIEFRVAQVDDELPMEDHLDPAKNPNIKSGLVKTTGAVDWIVKLDLTGLESGSSYVYGFLGPDGETSRVGLTKTAPALDAEVEQMQYAVFSCAHFSNGYFHAYDVASTLSELDFWVHVGDYIYEYGTYSTYASNAPERKNLTEPVWEIVSLQDYRLRYAQYHRDQGLQNLRARAPQVSTWDDHETTNDSYGDGTVERSGAENHQEVCPANRTSPIEEKQEANCDIDEGPFLERMNHAAQAYMEWMPLRRGPFGTMAAGNVDTDITQVIEWGNLATLVLLDSRVSERSEEPAGTTHFAAFGPAFGNLDVSTYTEEPALSTFTAIHETVMAEVNNPNYTMIGSKTDYLEETFAASKAAGKPWQIYGAATMLGPLVPPNLNTIHSLVEDPTMAAAVRHLTNATLSAPDAGLFRAAAAMTITQTPWNGDDYNGYGAERAKILDICKNSAQNCIILGGDLHDAWAWQLYEGGTVEKGNPVAVNLGTAGVTSPGWGAFLQPIFAPIMDVLGGPKAVNELCNAGFEDVNPGLVYGSIGRNGFFVVTATHKQAHVNYFGFDASTMLTSYDDVTFENNELTAPFTCDAHLISTAGEPGSLVKVEEECNAKFDTVRPAVWGIPLPVSETTDGLMMFEDCDMNACTVNVTSLESTDDENADKEDNDDNGQNGGAIFGVIIGCTAGIAIGIFIYHKLTVGNEGDEEKDSPPDDPTTVRKEKHDISGNGSTQFLSSKEMGDAVECDA